MGLMKNFTWKWLNTALKLVASFSFNLSIVTEAFKRLHLGVCGLFLCQNRPNGHALKIPVFRGKILQTPHYS